MKIYMVIFGGMFLLFLKWVFHEENKIKAGRTVCLYQWAGLDDRAVCIREMEKNYCGVKCWELHVRAGLEVIKEKRTQFKLGVEGTKGPITESLK